VSGKEANSPNIILVKRVDKKAAAAARMSGARAISNSWVSQATNSQKSAQYSDFIL
jgi:hypothetical protein